MTPGGTMEFMPALLQDTTTGALPLNRVTEAASSAGVGTGFYADRHIQALLQLMQQNKYGRVLAQPEILVNDNEEGSIDTKTTTYVARTNESVNTNSNTPVTSTSYSFEEFPSGIELMIIPHISEGNLLRLEIEMSRSQQDSAQQAVNTPPPDITENNIKTIVTVPDQSTIILGGVQQINQDKNTYKVPFLSDIPLVGGLFRSIDNSDVQSKLYIFVKANIVRPDEMEGGLPNLTKESDMYKEAYEEAEKDWQQHKSWPGIKAKPMDPETFLDVR